MSLRDRIFDYESRTDYKLVPRIPLVISLNGRSFSKITSLVGKPHSEAFSQAMISTMTLLATSVENTVFAYTFSDEIVLISNNENIDAIPWYDNSVQKIVSSVSAMASVHFNQFALANDIELTSDAIFLTKAFNLPNHTECVNYLIQKQFDALHKSVNNAFQHSFSQMYERNKLRELMSELDLDQKIKWLSTKLGIHFDEMPMHYRVGVAGYRAQKLINGNFKLKWFTNMNPPYFAEDQSFLLNIIKNGFDVVRQTSIED
jgi:tRNA(His) guanylyltransferase